MKALRAVVLAWFALVVIAGAASETNPVPSLAGQKVNATLSVKRLQSTGKTVEHLNPTYVPSGGKGKGGKGGKGGTKYSSSKSVSSGVEIEADVHSLSTNQVTLSLNWWFVARALRDDQLWVCDSGSKMLELGPPATSAKEKMASPVLQGSESGADGHGGASGSRLEGYVVILTHYGKAVRTEASSRRLEELASSPDKLNKLPTSEPE